jgi:hypothetical protein
MADVERLRWPDSAGRASALEVQHLARDRSIAERPGVTDG